MSVILRDVKRKKAPNPGGMVNLYLAKAEDVEMIPAITIDPATGAKVISTDITIKAGAPGFKKFEFDPGTCKLSHPTVGEDGSKSQETLIDFMISGDDDRLDIFDEMLNGDYIAITDAASKVMRVVGDLRVPLIMINTSYDGGGDQPEKNGTTFQLKGRGGRNSVRYTGVIPAGA